MSVVAVSRGGVAGRALVDEVRATVARSITIALTQIAQMALHTTDVVMTGWLGPHASAAGQRGHSLFFPGFSTTLGVLFATAAMFAQDLGARRDRGVRRTVRQGFWVIAVMTVPAWLIFWHAEAVLVHALGQDPALSVRSAEYAFGAMRSEEHTSEIQSLMRNSYAGFCLN